jgi:hypothetical protein
MPTIVQHLQELLPDGTNPGAGGSLGKCPAWPPDLFAVAAAVLASSSYYATPPFTAGWDKLAYIFTDTYVAEVRRIAEKWAQTGTVPSPLQKLWRDFTRNGDAEFRPALLAIVIRLLAIADAASLGVGFAPATPDASSKPTVFPTIVLEALLGLAARKRPVLPYVPSSLCIMVPNTKACVQPKTNTPLVGCTLRSLSHNLAFLPPINVVATSWLFMHPAEESRGPFNILLVPYPYVVNANDFEAVVERADEQQGFFTYRGGWRDRNDKLANPVKIADAICALISSARRETEKIHGVALPECALTSSQAARVAAILARKNPDLELFVSGTVTSQKGSSRPRNCAYTARLYRGTILDHWSQSKHHRWSLEARQIGQYHLGSILDPNRTWWEKIDVSNRTCVFTVVRWGASLTVLVCEDLARFEPVLPIINAVGPNLVIALLMDGPQLERRWPGRYATVLADDPGSAVLTLTSLGMIRRSSMPGAGDQRQIALWKQAGGTACELSLPVGDHALLLSLTSSPYPQKTMDRRDDDGATRRFVLSGARGVRFDKDKIPKWLRLD